MLNADHPMREREGPGPARKVETSFTRSSLLLAVAVSLVGIALLDGWLMIREIERSRNDSRLINYVGVLRGSIQRIAKVAATGGPVDQVCLETARHLAELKGEGRSGRKDILSIYSVRLREEIAGVESVWETFCREAEAYASAPSPEARDRLLRVSESNWTLANRIVSSAQSETEGRARYFGFLVYVITAMLLVSFLIVVYLQRFVKDKLEFLASHDALTKAMNRFSFNAILSRELQRSSRYRVPLTLILIDLDHFKTVNDQHGHWKGDLVLKAMAKVFQSAIRSTDRLFRIGGEEFAVLAVQTGLAEGRLLAERIRTLIEQKNFRAIGPLTVSLGVAECASGDSVERFYRKADEMLYKAKTSGRNRVEVFGDPGAI